MHIGSDGSNADRRSLRIMDQTKSVLSCTYQKAASGLLTPRSCDRDSSSLSRAHSHIFEVTVSIRYNASCGLLRKVHSKPFGTRYLHTYVFSWMASSPIDSLIVRAGVAIIYHILHGLGKAMACIEDPSPYYAVHDRHLHAHQAHLYSSLEDIRV